MSTEDDLEKTNVLTLTAPASPPPPEKMGVFSRLLRLSPLGPKAEAADVTEGDLKTVEQPPQPAQTYFGVYIPCESKIGPDEEILHVYKNKSEALAVVKKYKKARFKLFKNHQEAVAFALKGTEPSLDKSHVDGVPGFIYPEKNFTLVNNNIINGEKASLFKGPKPQEMVAFRKEIEAGDLNKVRKIIWDNPRYLISSGDTPSILQEGSRYNALHVSVRARNVEMCELILSTVSDPKFIEHLYGDDSPETCKERAKILLDLYLNTPDKSINETPLHFASKFGAKDIVDLLVSYPQCIRNQKNKLGEEAKDIINQRNQGAYDSGANTEIAAMLQERFYVPVLHSEDNSRQPTIGEPFSPGSPPSLNTDPVSPRIEIRAFAGPMNRESAYTFRKKWKTPPRTMNMPGKNPLAAARFRLKDTDKGLERTGRDLATELKIEWKEYWPFLDTFTDLPTDEGLGLLENHLKNEYLQTWNETSIINDDSLSFSPKSNLDDSLGHALEKKSNSPSVADHKLKNHRILDTELSPMSDLCMTFKGLTLNNNHFDKLSTSPKSLAARQLELKLKQENESENVRNLLLNPGLSPYLCIERSCQVFAKRLDNLLVDFELNAESLKTEIKHSQQTIGSYMDDCRFANVEFNLVHSRIAQITAQKLDNENRIELSKKLKETLEIFDSCSSEDDDYIISNRPYYKKGEKDKHFDNLITGQIRCLLKSVIKWISNENLPSAKALQTEDDCIKVWSDLFQCNCTWQTDYFNRNNRKNASLKRSQIKARDGSDVLSTSPRFTDYVPKKLIFEPENDGNNQTPEDGSNNSAKPSDEIDTRSFGRDDTDASDDSDDDAAYQTPGSSALSDESDYDEAVDVLNGGNSCIDVFIHGNKPTKDDRLAFDALRNCPVDPMKYPYVCRWKYTIGQYPVDERTRWSTNDTANSDDLDSPMTCSFNLGHISTFSASTPDRKNIRNICSVSMDETGPKNAFTPVKSKDSPSMTQVSKWMRVTGQNSPKSTRGNSGPNRTLNY